MAGSSFDLAIAVVLGNEGGFNCSPHDEGGATNFGLSLRFLRSLSDERLRRYSIFEQPTVSTIQNLTQPQAELIYKGEFWEAAPFAQIGSQQICNYVFDACVNMGLVTGIKILQRAFWAISAHYMLIKDDGILGESTLSSIGNGVPCLLPALMAERAGVYRTIAAKIDIDGIFLEGWLKRAYRA